MNAHTAPPKGGAVFQGLTKPSLSSNTPGSGFADQYSFVVVRHVWQRGTGFEQAQSGRIIWARPAAANAFVFIVCVLY